MPRLNWNEIRVNAAKFAEKWKGEKRERSETQSFYNEFFEVFGVSRRKVASFEEPVKKLNNKQGFIDLFWRKTLLVEHKSAGKNLDDAKAQALEYFVGIKDEELPRYLLICDFHNFHLFDLDEGNEVRFNLSALPDHIEAFGFILGIQKRTFRDQAPVNIAASEKMGSLHDALLASGYHGHDLERLLVRLLFCLFADDTGIFEPKDLFADLIRDCTKEDGSDLGLWLTQFFETLNEDIPLRQSSLDRRLNEFPYINGNLFAERLRVPSFTRTMRDRLLEACDFNWDAISPAIFGALFQSVMQPKERREKGAHYTTERNILKVIEPLFLDDLRAEFKRLLERRDNSRLNALRAFHNKIANLRFFDPACGCGNFLIIAYRELRELELALLRELNPGGQQVTEIEIQSRCNVNQFYGIEKEEFPARIAEVAMWMTDHIANVRLTFAFRKIAFRIPLKASATIRHADALETDWNDLLPAEACDYVFGNPPFIGVKYQTTEQREQVRRLAGLGGSGGTLDYVAAWFLKAGSYIREGKGRIGFVSTNSITQGEQVAPLWGLLFDQYGLEISFAHRTFAWGSDARGMAHVHVIIVGLTKASDAPKERRLYSYTGKDEKIDETRHSAISPYLTDASLLANPYVTVREANSPLNGMPKMVQGVQTSDFGHLIFSPIECEEFIVKEPAAASFMRPYIGAEELINRKERFILVLKDATPAELRKMPHVLERLERVRQSRLASQKAATRVLSNMPALFDNGFIPVTPYLVVPKVSSERRDYIPIAYLEPPIVPSNLTRVLPNAERWQFALLTSRIHMSWMRAVGGRLKSDYQYTIGVIYNTFPLPLLSDKSKAALSTLADQILHARTQHPTSSLADLYDPLTMPADLRKAHTTLDTAVDKLYRSTPFASDRERVEHLLTLYEEMTAPLLALAQAKPKRKKAGSTSQTP